MVVTPYDNRSISIEENLDCEVRDGSVLRGDVYHPSDDGHYPVLLCRTPYDKQNERYIASARMLASRGYTVVVQDIRGRYESEGEWVWQFAKAEKTSDADDGYDAVEWAAALPWSDGQVGTWGHSYPSWCIWRLAGAQPPSLKALFASGMSARSTDMNFGVFETGRRLEWAHGMAVDARRRAGFSHGPVSKDQAAKEWKTLERYKWVWSLPLEAIPDDVFSTISPMLRQYYREQGLDVWDFNKIHPRVSVPTCQLTGWWDRLLGTADNFTGMVTAGTVNLRDQHRLVIGPWGHDSGDLRADLGPVDHGALANARYEDVVLRWYDHHFKGYETGIGKEAPVRLFIMGENTWHFENEWPLDRTRYTDFFLSSKGGANTPFGDGVLTRDVPAGERPDEYDYDPANPVMSLMSENSQAAPCDQSPLDGRHDVLVYQTDPLQTDIQVTGPMTLKLWASTDGPETDFTAKLIDVHPNGLAVNLSYGIMRTLYRNGYDQPSLTQARAVNEYTIKLMPTGILFRQGHRIRLDVSSSDFPNFDRNHNTGADFWSDAELRVAHQTVFHDRERPSRLVLPVIPR